MPAQVWERMGAMCYNLFRDMQLYFMQDREQWYFTIFTVLQETFIFALYVQECMVKQNI